MNFLTLNPNGSSFLSYLLLAGVLFGGCNNPSSSKQEDQHLYYLFIGTYNPADSNSLFVYRFNSDSGIAQLISTTSGIKNPTFFTLSPNHQHLYAVSETHHNNDGKVFAYSFHPKEGKLTFVNKQLVEGEDPCNIITDTSGQWLFVSNYTSGNLSVFPLKANGSIGKISQHIQHHGHSIVSPNQDKAHVHCAIMAPNNKDLFVTDLGMDQVFTYSFNEKTGHLSAGTPPTTTVTEGSGPRLMEFSPDGKYLYLIHELGGQITVFRYQSGKLKKVQEISNLPQNYKGRIWSADIHLSPDGKYLYAANRDDLNDIVTYKVNKSNGKITPIDRQSTRGKTPRNFMISPDGRYVLIGHKNSGDVTIFKRDKTSGRLTLTDNSIPVAHAVCLKMIPIR